VNDVAQPHSPAAAFERLRAAVGSVVIGQDQALRYVFLTLLCSGHSLLEGVPGVAKTLLVRTVAAALGVRFGRIQFTPDLLPSDIIGTTVFQAATGEVQFRAGPIFTDLLLADEVNRASSKTQAALLEAMQERTVTVDGRAHALGPHFGVFATQNPVEQEGTYPLPEAELDRFLFKVVVDYPAEPDEVALLAAHHDDGRTPGSVEMVLSAADLDHGRQMVKQVTVSEEILGYVAALVRATRADVNFALGVSPRGGLMLLRAAKANAAIEGRDYVLPEDVQEVFLTTLRHRVQIDPGAEVEGMRPDQALQRTLAGVTVPR
jgi:MoxR-like ATPase